MITLLMIVLNLTAVFIIVLVLIQRGKGGGLAGALGGMGGQSAFGTKAGDMFTRITIGVAAFWIILCIAAVIALPKLTGGPLGAGGGPAPGPQQPPASKSAPAPQAPGHQPVEKPAQGK
jgi:protein translocase SecG subunit